MLHPVVNTRVQPKGQTIPGRIYVIDHAIQISRFVGCQMQDRAENLTLKIPDPAYGNQRWGNKGSGGRRRQFRQHTPFASRVFNIFRYAPFR